MAEHSLSPQAPAHQNSRAGFTLVMTGQLESVHIRNHEYLFCSYEVVHGPDWVKTTVSRMFSVCNTSLQGGENGGSDTGFPKWIL